ncbi:penicillin-binding protein 1C [Reichenbachiella agarivorans]|uniref:peptidoglycan glycosyltransferase n=1 Tax=Reichenbachiella agarivorans TaxID=2979464 RepID=A0ABY6CSM1_9BACT|nr:penicillin-binding protein 1C [Reichenbachiella agarivorans]UXP33512.1 penicillin-binding protein 1C [Reichenbachiella agarivorans]
MNSIKHFISKRSRRQRILIAVPLVSLFLFLLIPLPDPIFDVGYATTLETREGRLLGAMIAEDGQWRFPAQDSVPYKFEVGIKLFEDEYFDQHFGINPVSTVKALLSNIQAGEIKRGGSTLSMQVIRMARNNPSRTILEKCLEMLMALKLELFYSKQEILALYASHAPFGGNVVGLDAAAWRYYGRSSSQLSWGEATALAVLPNSPALIFPGKNENFLEEKRNRLLRKLLDRAVIDSLTYRLAIEEELPGRPKDLPRLAPHLLTRANKDGKRQQRIVTTLDPRLQSLVSQRANDHIQEWKHNHIHNAAVLVVEIETGEVKAYIGNVASGALHGEEVDVIPALRSTGSLLKPFLYAAAIDEGLIAPQQLLKDFPLIHKGFAPQNFDRKYRGAVAADEALRRSLNLPFVNLLIDYGYERFHQQLRNMGMKNLRYSADHYGLSIILGGSESSLWEMTNMYSNMYRSYNNGIKRSITASYNPSDYAQLVYSIDQVPAGDLGVMGQPMSIAASWATLSAMTGLTRPEEYEEWEQISGSENVAWKTGTSYGFRDAWAIGINGKYAVGVWVGNADGEGRPALVGVRAAAPLMFSVFSFLDGKLDLPVPTAETISESICIQSGQRANPHCVQVEARTVPATVARAPVCEYHQLLHLDSTERYQVNSSCYPVQAMKHQSWFVLPPVQAWYYRQYHSDYDEAPEFLQACDEQDSKEVMTFIYPKNRSKIFIPNEVEGKRGKAIFELAHRDNQQKVFWHLDGEYLGQTTSPHQMGITTGAGEHLLYLLDGEGHSQELIFTVVNN